MTTEQRFWNKVRKTDTCWLWIASLRHKGYGAFAYTRNGVMVQDRAHRYSWTIHNGEIPEGLCVLHRCDVPACVNPKHLFLGTKADNNADMVSKGRLNRYRTKGRYRSGVLVTAAYRRGEDHPGATLTAEKVKAIRNARAEGESFGSLSNRFGLSVGHVFRIVTRKVWSHV